MKNFFLFIAAHRTNISRGTSLLRLFLAVSCLLTLPVYAQIRTSWFDINPSSSNTDNDNPNGSSGGRINHMGATSDLRQVFAASEWGGLYTSFNQGLTWVKVNSFSPSAAWDVKVDPR